MKDNIVIPVRSWEELPGEDIGAILRGKPSGAEVLQEALAAAAAVGVKVVIGEPGDEWLVFSPEDAVRDAIVRAKS